MPFLRVWLTGSVFGMVCAFFAQPLLAESSIKGTVGIGIDLKSVRNIIQNSNNSKMKTRIGSIQRSELGSVSTKIDVNQVKNTMNNAVDSSSVINIGSIYGTKSGKVSIKVNAKNITNEVRGKNNHAKTNIGVLEDANIHGGVKIEVRAREISNVIRGGSNNEAEVSIGYDPETKADSNVAGYLNKNQAGCENCYENPIALPAKKPLSPSPSDPGRAYYSRDKYPYTDKHGNKYWLNRKGEAVGINECPGCYPSAPPRDLTPGEIVALAGILGAPLAVTAPSWAPAVASAATGTVAGVKTAGRFLYKHGDKILDALDLARTFYDLSTGGPTVNPKTNKTTGGRTPTTISQPYKPKIKGRRIPW